jgi:hypothetical protein
MSRRTEARALRKKLLLARSTLHRLEIRKDLLAIGNSWNLGGGRREGFSLRNWLFDALVGRIASAPVARILGVLTGVISLAQVLRIGTAIAREAGAEHKERTRNDDVVVERMAPPSP